MADSKYDQTYTVNSQYGRMISNAFDVDSNYLFYTYDAGSSTWYYAMYDGTGGAWDIFTSSVDPSTLSDTDALSPSDIESLSNNADTIDGKFRPWSGETEVTYNPSAGDYTGGAVSGENNYYVQGPDGDATTEGGMYQEADVTASTAFTLSALVGGRFSDDGVYIEAEFYNSGDSLIGAEDNNTLLYGDAFTPLNGTFVKTSLRGAVDYDAGYKFEETGNSDYPVYYLMGDKTKLIMKNLAFSSDRWSMFEADGWDFDDLTDDYALGSYTENIISTSGDDTRNSLKYPQIADSEVVRYSDFYVMGYNADMRYQEQGNYDESFDKNLSVSATSPSGADHVRVTVSYEEESSSTCYAFLSHVKYEE